MPGKTIETEEGLSFDEMMALAEKIEVYNRSERVVRSNPAERYVVYSGTIEGFSVEIGEHFIGFKNAAPSNNDVDLESVFRSIAVKNTSTDITLGREHFRSYPIHSDTQQVLAHKRLFAAVETQYIKYATAVKSEGIQRVKALLR